RRRQMLGVSLKILAIGEHRQTSRTACLVAASDRWRIEDRSQDALARARLFDLGDHRGTACRDFRAERAYEVAWRRRTLRVGTQADVRSKCLRRSDLLRLGRKNALENVGAAQPEAFAPSFCVVATNRSSFSLAAPEAIAARARSIPSLLLVPMLVATRVSMALCATVTCRLRT